MKNQNPFRAILVTGLLFFASCGTQYNPQSVPQFRCLPPIADKDYSSCCSGQGGPGSTGCGAGEYLFNGNDKLICADNSISSSCTY